MIYSPTHRLVFLKTRKTAGTSIEIELSRHMDDRAVITPIYPEEAERVKMSGRGAQNYLRRRRPRTLRECAAAVRDRHLPDELHFWNHMTAAEVRERLGSEWEGAAKIAVVRNPWEVLASRFHMERQRRPDIRTVNELIDHLGITSNWPIYTIDDQIVADVVRYENLAEDLPRAVGRVGIDLGALPHIKSGDGRPHYREVLAAHHVDQVAEACRSEIETFGYEF